MQLTQFQQTKVHNAKCNKNNATVEQKTMTIMTKTRTLEINKGKWQQLHAVMW